MASDKKARAGRVRFALMREPGVCEVHAVDDTVLGARLQRWAAGERGV
jgi:3-dehydroquinate synthetase